MASSSGEIQMITDEKGRKFCRFGNIETREIPAYDFRDSEVDKLILRQQPVILQNSGLVASADKWTLTFLEQNLGDDLKNVYFSKTRKFMFYNDEKRCSYYPQFTPPIKSVNIPFKEFVKKLHAWKPGDKRIYYQERLTTDLSPFMFNDFKHFHWDWLKAKQEHFGWEELTSNLLLISQPGNITPLHFDEQQNFFAQVHGYKRVILLDPKYYRCLYPYPYHHPCDRQSQVDFDNLDYEKFPLVKHIRGMETVLGPGDVLYIPMYWWHYIESTEDSEITTSINFWYKNTNMSLKDLKFPLNWQHKTTMTRNIEKMLAEALGSPTEVGPLLNAIVKGRYTQNDDDINFEKEIED